VKGLLEAMLDAVEIYYHGRRRLYKDAHGKPKPLDYDDLVFNALHGIIGWIKPLRDYIEMYAKVQGATLPVHLDALRIIEEIAYTEDGETGDVLLKYGLSTEQAITSLIAAIGCDTASVRRAAAKNTGQAGSNPENPFLSEALKQLRLAMESPDTNKTKLVEWWHGESHIATASKYQQSGYFVSEFQSGVCWPSR